MSTPRKILIKMRKPVKKASEEELLPGIAEVKERAEMRKRIDEEYAPLEGVAKYMDERNFDINNKRFILTYKTHIDKTELEKFLWDTTATHCRKGLKSDDTGWMCIVAHETSDAISPYDHTHVYMHTGKGKSFRSKSPRIFDFNEIHPHIQKIEKTPDRAIAYVCKQDPLLAELREEYPMDFVKGADGKKVKGGEFTPWEAIKNCKTIDKAMGMMKKWSDATGIKAAWDISIMNKHAVDEESRAFRPWGWQWKLLDILEDQPDARSIHWWWSKEGKTGKTSFCKWIYTQKPKDFLILQGVGYYRDMSTIIVNEIQKGWTGHGIIFNITRTYQDVEFIWQTLEAVKDGWLTATKYQGGTAITPRPHVVVFANFPPKIAKGADGDGRDLISRDRIKTVKIKVTARPKHYPPEWQPAKKVLRFPKYIRSLRPGYNPDEDSGPEDAEPEGESEDSCSETDESESEEDVPIKMRVRERNRLGEQPDITVIGDLEE
jgi:hypothetical protein